MEKPDPKTTALVQNYMERFIYEHPDTIFKAYMGYHNEWRKWLWENAPSDLLQLYNEYIPSIDQAKEREINRRAISPIGQGMYHRHEWPSSQHLPTNNWRIAQRISSDIYGQLLKLPYSEALDFISELVVAWFFSCPITLLQLDSAYPVKFPDQATDIDYVNVLWDFYYGYIRDSRHAKYTREDFDNQIERVRNRRRWIR